MSTRGIPKKSARLFRITHGVFGILFGAVAAWLFATSRAPVVAWIFAVAAGFALLDTIIGWRPSRD
jgi:zinc transporter ZupT